VNPLEELCRKRTGQEDQEEVTQQLNEFSHGAGRIVHTASAPTAQGLGLGWRL
jgi:hypothetical protein